MQQSESIWPLPRISGLKDLPGLKPIKRTNNSLVASNNLFDPFTISSYLKLIRTYAYVLRFYNNIKLPITRKTGQLTPEKLDCARLCSIKFIQAREFHTELDALFKKKTIPPCSKLKSLNLYLDKNGVIRVGGRLAGALIPSSKNPYHANTQFILHHLRLQYWVLNAKSTIKQLLKTCVHCIKEQPNLRTQLMGNLPAYRVTPGPAFTYTGVDFCGAFSVRIYNNCSRALLKVYVLVFICMTVKAVHLEIVSDLTTKAFIAPLDRFVSRRGRPHTMFSNNGTNFVGAKRIFYEIMASNEIFIYSTNEGFEWKFNPPAAPHFGGL